MKRILKWLYKRNHDYFNDLMVQELIGQIPKEVNEPALEFLRQGREKMERWILFHAYFVNRKMASSPQNHQFYYGMMVYLKVLLWMSSRGKKVTADSIGEVEIQPVGTKKDPLEGVNEFMQYGKDKSNS